MSDEATLRALAMKVRNWGRWEATAAAARVAVQRGDLLLIHTGHMSRYLDKNDWRHFDLGVSVHTTAWMHDRQVAAVASDNYAVEVRPADCATDGRYAFLLVAPPLPVKRAVGTPINPYALK
jgi:kynurenine formamidase